MEVVTPGPHAYRTSTNTYKPKRVGKIFGLVCLDLVA